MVTKRKRSKFSESAAPAGKWTDLMVPSAPKSKKPAASLRSSTPARARHKPTSWPMRSWGLRSPAVSDLPYLPTAPSALVMMHSAGGVYRELLGRALTDPAMLRCWRALGSVVRSDQQWRRLWGDVVHLLVLARKHARYKSAPKGAPTRSETVEAHERARALTRQLRAALEDAPGAPLDHPAYELFPEDVMALTISGWGAMDHFERVDAAHSRLRDWPTIGELLAELERRAARAAQTAATEPRLIVRRTGPKLFLARGIARRLERELGRRPSHGAVAALTSAMLGIAVTTKEAARAVE